MFEPAENAAPAAPTQSWSVLVFYRNWDEEVREECAAWLTAAHSFDDLSDHITDLKASDGDLVHGVIDRLYDVQHSG